jgi:MerR family transcriptional regulator, copper efflux regulator
MLIGELAKTTGLSKDTIRFYEKMGLIDADERQAGTRTYKEFSSLMVERLMMITQGKSLGFTLNEIKYLIQAWGNDIMPTDEKIRVIDSKLEEISEKIQKLEQIKIYLTTKRNGIIGKPDIVSG